MREPLSFVFFVVAAILVVVGAVHAQGGGALAAAQESFSTEPTVREAVRAGNRCFRTEPEALDDLRSRARMRAAIPLLAGGYQYTVDDWARRDERELFQPYNLDQLGSIAKHSATIGAIWDIRDAIFSANEVQVYGLVGIQRDIMLEVTRTFFLRRQLMIRLLLRPPEDPVALTALQLRVDEFTALLDTMTCGWFDKEIQRRRRREARRQGLMQPRRGRRADAADARRDERARAANRFDD